MPADPARAKSLFLAASDLPDEAARAAFLDRECGGDADLRGRVEALLRADAGPDPAATADLPADPPTGTFAPGRSATTLDDPGRDAQAGAVIAGKYTLVEPVGEGGMGAVWRARQTEPVKRFVAVKLIKAGMDSRQVLARFEAERQALALMDHPNIAKVLDGGVHAGRPYFVMELVKGVPITDYCDARKLTPRERLELFVPVCGAVQHAHQKGVIHRDLKPSNVLVAMYDDRPVPKVIDFGVAKATGPALTERTIDTGFGGVVGTPQYMSPEQATFNNLDIDTRSDVYALGVLLYELLAGSPPFSRKDLERKGLLEILRVVREEEPPRPSAKLSTADALPTLSANRGTEPKKLTGLLRSELDWIVMKALEKDRSRRYETANGFAADVQRYLAGEPVVAHPPTVGYRLRKFYSRHRAAIGTALLVVVTLKAVAFFGWWQAHRALVAEAKAEQQRDEAKRQEGLARDEAAEKERQRGLAEQAADAERRAKDAAVAATAEKERARAKEAEERGYAEAVADFVRADFLALTSVEGQGRWGGQGLTRNATLKELLDRAAEKLLIRTDLPDRTVGDLAWIIGVSYRNLGEHDRAISFLALTAKSRLKRLGADDPETLEAQNSLAVAYQNAGRTAEAIALHEETLKLRKARLGPDHQATLMSMANLAISYPSAGRLAEALTLGEETLKLQKAKLGPNHPNTLMTMCNLATGYHAAGRLAEAIPLWEETLKRRKAVQGPDHNELLTTTNNLASGYFTAGRLAEALPLWEETLKLQKIKLGPDHADTLITTNNLAWGYQGIGKNDLAVPLFEETLRLTKAKHGPDHPHTLQSMYGLASGYRAAGQLDLAVPLFEETLKRMKAKLPPNDPLTLETMNGLAGCYRDIGKLDLALPLLEETVELMKARLGPDHPTTLNSISGVAASYWSLKRLDKSVPLFEEVLRLQEKKLGRDHPSTQGTVANLGVNYKDAGRPEEAVTLLEEAYRAAQKYPSLRGYGPALLDAYAMAGETAKYDALLKEQLTDARRTLPKGSLRLAGLLAEFGLRLSERKQWTEAEPLLREALAVRENGQPDAWSTFNTQSLLGGALLGQNKYADAEPLLLRGYEGMKAREKAIPPQAGTRLPEALDRLVELYAATNKPDEAARWRAERAKYPSVAPPPRPADRP